jgi:outer membrane lipoprotein-sorting protein
MASRQAVLVLSIGALVGLAGCNAGTSGGLSPRAEPTLPKLSAIQAIERHNENAKRVVALQAEPVIVVSMPGQSPGKVDGRLALERPKNFKLVMKSIRGQEADIGSNDDEFWFWVNNKQDKRVYVCSYEDVDRTRLSAGFQPDWIVEAMGLRTISHDEADKMTVKSGDHGTMKLISTRTGSNGSVLTKETVIDGAGLIREHHLFQGQGKNRVLVASAVIDRSQNITAPDGSGTVTIPSRFRLTWVQEQLNLDITLRDVQLVAGFSESQRHTKFVEPDDANLKRTNLAETVPAPSTTPRSRAAADPPARTRTSRSVPPIRTGVDLGSEPLSLDTTQPARDPSAAGTPVSWSRATAKVDPIVRPDLPRPDDQ